MLRAPPALDLQARALAAGPHSVCRSPCLPEGAAGRTLTAAGCNHMGDVSAPWSSKSRVFVGGRPRRHSGPRHLNQRYHLGAASRPTSLMCRKQYVGCLESLIELPSDPPSPLLGTPPKELMAGSGREICTAVLTTARCAAAET